MDAPDLSVSGTLNVSALSGLGNIVMTRTCTPAYNNYAQQNVSDFALGFNKLSLTYVSTASESVSW
jgi:hypothetical protein